MLVSQGALVDLSSDCECAGSTHGWMVTGSGSLLTADSSTVKDSGDSCAHVLQSGHICMTRCMLLRSHNRNGGWRGKRKRNNSC